MINYEIDQKLGANLVPLIVEREIDGKIWTLQLWVRRTDTTALEPYPDSLSLFDFLTNNYDRHAKNYLTYRGRQIAIDNEDSMDPTFYAGSDRFLGKMNEFIDDYLHQKNSLTDQTQLSQAKTKAILGVATILSNKKMIERLRTIPDQEWRNLFRGKLSTKQAEAFLVRKNQALQTIDRALQILGSDILPEAPFSPLVRVRKREK